MSDARAPRRSPIVVAGIVALLLVAGVVGFLVRSGDLGSGAEEAGGGATGATGAASEAAPVPADEAVTDLERAGTTGGAVGVDQVGAPGRIIRTAEMSLEIPRDAFDDRFGQAVDVAEANGGFVADSRSRERSGSLTLRVPADRFGETLRELRALGTVVVESVHGQDVTAEYVDLEARLRISEARRDVLLGLMAEATSIAQTIRVQNALSDTQLAIEQFQGQLRLLDDQTALATVHLEMREEGAESDPGTPSIPNAFERAVAGFVGTIAAVVIGLGYVLPIAILGLVGWFVVVRVRRRTVG